MMLGLSTSLVSTGVIRSTEIPPGSLPADAYQEPIANGNEGYWSYQLEGFYQEPEP